MATAPRTPPKSRKSVPPTQPKDIPSVRAGMIPRSSMFDSLQNFVSGLGTSKDKSTSTDFLYTEMDVNQLEQAYRSDWVARKIVNIPAEDATREWRKWDIDKDDIATLEKAESKLFLRSKVLSAIKKGRLYGGGALLMGLAGTKDLSQPLDPKTVGKDALQYVHAVSRYELSAGEVEWDIRSPYYGTPKWYTRAAGADDTGLMIHPSRVVRFIGNEAPNVNLAQGWSDSVLQVVRDAIMGAGIASASGSQLLSELKVDVLHIPDLTSHLSNEDYAKRLTDRFALANVAKSLYSMLILDKEEEWERIDANLTGLPDVVKMYLLIASGAADIPVTRMLGQSPAGMSATGESDLRNYYDHIRADQNNVVTPSMTVLDEIFLRSSLGTQNVEGATYRWNPLWQLGEIEQATVMTQKANVFKVDVDTALIPAEVLRTARINQLLEDGTYPGLDQILDDYGPLEPIDETPEEGSIIGPDGEPIAPGDPRHPNNQQPDPVVDPNDPAAVAAAAKKVKKAKKATPIGDMASRIRYANARSRKARAIADGVLRSLYIRRPVLNAAALVRWAKANKVPNVLPAADMHVTVMYSKAPVDWAKTGEPWDQSEDGTMLVRPGGMRVLQKFGNAIVLCFNSSSLAWRNSSLCNVAGCTWDYNDYQPHVTLGYLDPLDPPFELDYVAAYQGEIKFGPEVYAEATGNPYNSDAYGNPFVDYNENHDPANGEFSEGGGGSGSSEKGQGRVATIREGVKNLMTKQGAKDAIKKAVGKINENKLPLINGAIQGGLYHVAGVDYGPDIEKAIAHEIENFAQNAKVSLGAAKESAKNAVGALVAWHKKTMGRDSLQDAEEDAAILEALENLLKAINAYEPPAEEEPADE